MGKLQHIFGAAGIHKGVVYLILHDHSAQRQGAIGDLFGHIKDVGRHAKGVSAKHCARSPESGDDLIEYQQNFVMRAYFPQAL